MAYFAKLNEDNVVTGVYAIPDTHELTYSDWRKEFGEIYVQTSYNNRIRKQFASINYTYDADADVFVRPQPYPSWSLDSNHDWQPPTPQPEGDCYWDEESLLWLPIG